MKSQPNSPHVDRQMSDALRRIDECELVSLNFLTQLGHGINCAQRIRDMGKRKQFYLRRSVTQELFETESPKLSEPAQSDRAPLPFR